MNQEQPQSDPSKDASPARSGMLTALKDYFFNPGKPRILNAAEAIKTTIKTEEDGALVLYEHACPEAKDVATRIGATRILHLATRCSLDTLERSVETMLSSHEAFTPDDVRILGQEIANLARTFAEHTNTEAVRIRLESVLPSQLSKDDFAGKGFHLDKFSHRLLCAFAGPGLEWVAREDIDDDAFQSYFSHGREVDFLQGARIHQVEENHAAIFKGNELIHRRPHYAGTRVVLFVDQEY